MADRSNTPDPRVVAIQGALWEVLFNPDYGGDTWAVNDLPAAAELFHQELAKRRFVVLPMALEGAARRQAALTERDVIAKAMVAPVLIERAGGRVLCRTDEYRAIVERLGSEPGITVKYNPSESAWEYTLVPDQAGDAHSQGRSDSRDGTPPARA